MDYKNITQSQIDEANKQLNESWVISNNSAFNIPENKTFFKTPHEFKFDITEKDNQYIQ